MHNDLSLLRSIIPYPSLHLNHPLRSPPQSARETLPIFRSDPLSAARHDNKSIYTNTAKSIHTPNTQTLQTYTQRNSLVGIRPATKTPPPFLPLGLTLFPKKTPQIPHHGRKVCQTKPNDYPLPASQSRAPNRPFIHRKNSPLPFPPTPFFLPKSQQYHHGPVDENQL